MTHREFVVTAICLSACGVDGKSADAGNLAACVVATCGGSGTLSLPSAPPDGQTCTDPGCWQADFQNRLAVPHPNNVTVQDNKSLGTLGDQVTFFFKDMNGNPCTWNSGTTVPLTSSCFKASAGWNDSQGYAWAAGAGYAEPNSFPKAAGSIAITRWPAGCGDTLTYSFSSDALLQIGQCPYNNGKNCPQTVSVTGTITAPVSWPAD
jgi:hypothetical protein